MSNIEILKVIHSEKTVIEEGKGRNMAFWISIIDRLVTSN